MAWCDFKQVNGQPAPSKAGQQKPTREREPKTREQLETAIGAAERVKAMSDAIRERAGLEPVPYSRSVCLWRDRLANLPAAKRKAAKRKADLPPVDAIADIARRRRQLERDREALEATVCEAKASGVSASKIAAALGVSRQRVYQLAAA